MTREMTAEEGLAFVVAWLDSRPWSAEMLAASALTQMERLVDWHWEALTDDLLDLMAERADLCRVIQGSNFEVPDDVDAMLHRAADHGPIRSKAKRHP